MATSDREFYDAPKFTPEPYEPPRQRGCFFYGCIIASVLAVLFLIAVAILLYVAYRGLGQLVEQYTTTAPQELPAVEMPAQERQSLQERVDAFRKAVDAGTPTEPLVLTSEGCRWKRTGLSSLMARIGRDAGIDRLRVSAHKLRHTANVVARFARHEDGTALDRWTRSRLLTHENPQSLDRYEHLLSGELSGAREAQRRALRPLSRRGRRQ